MHSSTSQNAVRALIYLAERENHGPILVRDIAEAAQVSKPSLAKILHGLRFKNLVKSTKGPGGGYELLRPSEEITLVEIMEAVDGPLDLEKTCILGLNPCSEETCCALHDYWTLFREQYFSTIAHMSLKDAASTLEKKRLSEAAA